SRRELEHALAEQRETGRLLGQILVGRGLVSGASTQKVHLPFERVTSLGWSPDGTRFVVGAQAAGTAASDIYTLRTDGADLRRLTTDFDAGSPSWQ
ncbi:MAG: hypothetical protein ABW114_12710, partial [Gaiellaceae bacterium]